MEGVLAYFFFNYCPQWNETSSPSLRPLGCYPWHFWDLWKPHQLFRVRQEDIPLLAWWPPQLGHLMGLPAALLGHPAESELVAWALCHWEKEDHGYRSETCTLPIAVAALCWKMGKSRADESV